MTLAELSAYLVAVTPSLGLTEGATLFAYRLPQSSSGAEPIVALVPYGGRASEQDFGDAALAYEFPRVQVLVRGPVNDPAAGDAMAQAVYQAFGRIQAQTLSGTFHHQVTCLQPPSLLEWDANERPVFVFNIEDEKEVSAL